MIYFKWDALRKILYGTPVEYATSGWRLTFCCQHNQVYTVEREGTENKPPAYTAVRLQDVEVDLQRILADDFWGYIYVEGYGDVIISMRKKRVIKP